MSSTFIPTALRQRYQDFVAAKFGVAWLTRADGETRTVVSDRLVLLRQHGGDTEVFCGDDGLLKLLQDDFAAELAAVLNQGEPT